jgi:hypothetical protein
VSNHDDIAGGVPGDVSSDVTWMSYAELGRARGISAASAKRLAIRRRWRRQQGNDGTSRVAVPVTEAVPRETRPGDIASDDTGDITGVVSGFEAALTVLREQLDAANARADRAEQGRDGERARADALRDRIEALQAQLAAAEAEGTASDVEAAEMTAQLKQARAGAQAAAQDAEALRQVDAERRARGLVARLRAAWRGE